MKKYFRKSIIYLVAMGLLLPTWLISGLITAPRAQAAFGDLRTVVINEVNWMGNADHTSDEWIELYNTTNDSIDISGWQIDHAAPSSGSLTIPAGKTIPANGYFLISNYGLSDSNSVLNVASDWVTTDVSLYNNETNDLVLHNGVTIYDTAKTWAAGDSSGSNYSSMARKVQSSDGALASNWFASDFSRGLDSSSGDRGTPKSSNAPIITIGAYPTAPTHNNITVNASTDHGLLNVSSHTFSANGSFVFIVTNSDGLGSSKEVEINNIDTTPPTITMNGDNPMTVEKGSFFTDPSATAIDIVDGVVTVNTFGTVDTSVVGNYTLLYTATDSSGKVSTMSRSVRVVDTQKPVITITKDPNNPVAKLYKISIDYDTDSIIKLYKINNEGWQDYTGEFSLLVPDGDYTVYAKGIDNSGNIGESNAGFTVKNTQAGPTVSYSVSEKTINATWNKVDGASGYYFYLKSKANGAVSITDSRVTLGADVTTYSNNVLDYGDYYLVVLAYDSLGNVSVLPEAGKQTVVNVIAPVITPAVHVATVVPTTAHAATGATSTGSVSNNNANNNANSNSDANGKILGDTTNSNSDEGTEGEEKVNWTPWIVLFILILLAGAATGGYFYWFNGEENDEVKTVVKETKPVEAVKKPETPPAKPKPTARPNNNSGNRRNNKKQKRW